MPVLGIVLAGAFVVAPPAPAQRLPGELVVAVRPASRWCGGHAEIVFRAANRGASPIWVDLPKTINGERWVGGIFRYDFMPRHRLFAEMSGGVADDFEGPQARFRAGTRLRLDAGQSVVWTETTERLHLVSGATVFSFRESAFAWTRDPRADVLLFSDEIDREWTVLLSSAGACFAVKIRG